MTDIENYFFWLFVNGNYDILKGLLKWGFSRMKKNFEDWEEEKLKEQLSIILETNEDLKNKLIELQKWWENKNIIIKDNSEIENSFNAKTNLDIEIWKDNKIKSSFNS